MNITETNVIWQGQHWRAVEMPAGTFGWTESTTFTIQYISEGEWIIAPGYHGCHHPTAREDAIDAAKLEEAKGPLPPKGPRMFTWTIEVQVAEVWVEDGFDFTNDRCRSLSDSLIDYAESHEVKVRVLTAPDLKAIRLTQGYKD